MKSPSDEELSFILDLPVVRLPGIPQIMLRLAQADSGLGRMLAERRIDASPYWAYLWGGGMALALHLIANPHIVAGLRVLDVGTGSGLVAIAAGLCGARAVTALDNDPLAIFAAKANARLNNLELTVCAPAQVAPVPDGFDLVLAGDVFYAADVGKASLALLDSFDQCGVEVLIGDPGRRYLPMQRLDMLADYAIADFGEATGDGYGTVYRLKPAGRIETVR